MIVFIWFFSPAFIIVVHYLASGWHVTKQSMGVLKIYINNTKKYEFLIYLVSFACILIGLQSPGILTDYLNTATVNSAIGVSFTIYIIILFELWKK